MPSTVLLFALLAGASAAPTGEWPGLRGPHHDGSAARGSLFRGAEGEALVVAWRATLGPGYSGVAVAGDLAVTVFSNGTDDMFIAFDAATGRERWRHALAPTHKGVDGSFDGPIATPTVAGGRAFAFGPLGHLMAVELETGRALWRTDPPKDLGAVMPFYGFGSSPLVASGVLILPVGGDQSRAIAGFDPATGRRLFVLGDDKVTYQSPVVMRVGAEEQVVAVGGTKLFGIDPAGGRLLWEHPHGGDRTFIGSDSLVPVPAGEGRLFVKAGTDQTTMLRVRARAEGGYAVDELWTAPVLRTTFVMPVYHEGYLYGMNGRTVLTCVDAATGEQRWRSREPGEGFPMLVGGDLVVLTKESTLHVGPASPEGWKERARLALFQDLVWTPPSFAGGAVFARSQGEIARVEWGPPEGRAAAAPAAISASVPAASPLAPTPRFAAFRAEVLAATDKAKVVDQFLASVPSFPLVEGQDRVVFLYRGAASDMAIVGDLTGERREDPMTRLPGTDLFYYEASLEPDMRVSYEFVRNFEERLLDPRNPPGRPSRAFFPSTERGRPRCRPSPCPAGRDRPPWTRRPRGGGAASRPTRSEARAVRG